MDNKEQVENDLEKYRLFANEDIETVKRRKFISEIYAKYPKMPKIYTCEVCGKRTINKKLMTKYVTPDRPWTELEEKMSLKRYPIEPNIVLMCNKCKEE